MSDFYLQLLFQDNYRGKKDMNEDYGNIRKSHKVLINE